jgi:nitric oxide reductase NorD protein
LNQNLKRRTEEQLGRYAPSLVALFNDALSELQGQIPDPDIDDWVQEGLDLARHSLRSWEATSDYFRVGPAMRPNMDAPTFREWVRCGRDLSELSSAIAGAYFRASPTAMPHLAGAQIAEWAGLGQRLYKGTWKSISLASDFFAGSPVLFHSLSLAETGRLVRIIETISERSAELAAACLESSVGVFARMDRADRHAFLDFAAAVADASWPESNLYFQKGTELLRNVTPDERTHYLDLSARVARRIGRQAYTLFAEGANALRDIDETYHGRLIEMADRIVPISPVAAMSFLKSAPIVMVRLRIDELDGYHEAGLEILRESFEGGEAFFRLESGKAEQVIAALSARVDLDRVSELLRLYSKALTGTNISVHHVGALEEKGIGWVAERGASTEGTSIYLPEFVEEFETKAENFSVYKVYATHQAAHLEFGSFWFNYARNGAIFKRTRHQVERERRREGQIKKRQWLTDMERFFDLFPERQVGSDLFTIVEDIRIDSHVTREYGGIRRASRMVQHSELGRRPDVRQLPLKEAFIENLVRASLHEGAAPSPPAPLPSRTGGPGSDTPPLDGGRAGAGGEIYVWPKPLMPFLTEAISVLRALRAEGAIVEDSAEATLLLYDIVDRVPNIPSDLLQDMDWDQITEDMLEEMMRLEPGQAGGQGSDALDSLQGQPEDEYHSPEQVDFRGDFKPELVQLLMRLRLNQNDQQQGAEGMSPLTPEQLKELLEKSVEINITGMAEGDLASTIGLFLSNLEKEAGTPISDTKMDSDRQGQPVEEEPEVPELAPEVRTFYYDEWDFRAADYKPRWCAVRERILDEGTEDFYEKALRDHSSLVAETQRQFELLRPEMFRKIKKLEDGEDIDLDAAIEFMINKKAGHGEVPKVYWRRNKIERDVAVAFLLDMSASTDEEIEKRKKREDEDDFDDDPRKYFAWLAQRRTQQLMDPPKRIIDLEKESLVLLIKALEAIGDRYGIYGFSGYGRDNVEYFVIKDLDETFGEHVRKRVDKVTPIRSTRMGPAIRHTASKLLESDAKVKILFLVSDGRPQDHGYGRDRTEKEYAIHDTHKALVEAKHKGIIPFALTVDKEGHDYLGQMCGDMGYEILGDIEILPSRLPTLYRKLTE